MFDFIIVGQGIAGTCLAIRLLEAGKEILILDNGHQHSSSMVAAGIINPITGRNYTRSWMVDELISEVEAFYFRLQQEWGINFITKTSVIRTLRDAKSENLWYERMDNPSYLPYMAKHASLGGFESLIFPPFSYGEVMNAFQVDLPLFLHVFRSKNEDKIEHAQVDYSDILAHEDHIEYRGIKTKNMVFAEGYRAIHNPFLNDLPFQPAKGEILLIEIEGDVPEKILRDKMFICPVGKNLFWVGAGYARDDLDENTTETERQKLTAFLEATLKCPYRIIAHKAGVRPSTMDRRPILGRLPTHHNLYIFNGMGTKGTSLSPYWSKEMTDFMLQDRELPREVSIERFLKES